MIIWKLFNFLSAGDFCHIIASYSQYSSRSKDLLCLCPTSCTENREIAQTSITVKSLQFHKQLEELLILISQCETPAYIFTTWFIPVTEFPQIQSFPSQPMLLHLLAVSTSSHSCTRVPGNHVHELWKEISIFFPVGLWEGHWSYDLCKAGSSIPGYCTKNLPA